MYWTPSLQVLPFCLILIFFIFNMQAHAANYLLRLSLFETFHVFSVGDGKGVGSYVWVSFFVITKIANT